MKTPHECRVYVDDGAVYDSETTVCLGLASDDLEDASAKTAEGHVLAIEGADGLWRPVCASAEVPKVRPARWRREGT
jgi:hypothetical protein